MFLVDRRWLVAPMRAESNGALVMDVDTGEVRRLAVGRLGTLVPIPGGFGFVHSTFEELTVEFVRVSDWETAQVRFRHGEETVVTGDPEILSTVPERIVSRGGSLLSGFPDAPRMSPLWTERSDVELPLGEFPVRFWGRWDGTEALMWSKNAYGSFWGFSTSTDAIRRHEGKFEPEAFDLGDGRVAIGGSQEVRLYGSLLDDPLQVIDLGEGYRVKVAGIAVWGDNGLLLAETRSNALEIIRTGSPGPKWLSTVRWSEDGGATFKELAVDLPGSIDSATVIDDDRFAIQTTSLEDPKILSVTVDRPSPHSTST